MAGSSSDLHRSVASAFDHLASNIHEPRIALRPFRGLLQGLCAHGEADIASALRSRGLELAERLKKDGVIPPREIEDFLGHLISLSVTSDGSPRSSAITEALQHVLKVVEGGGSGDV